MTRWLTGRALESLFLFAVFQSASLPMWTNRSKIRKKKKTEEYIRMRGGIRNEEIITPCICFALVSVM